MRPGISFCAIIRGDPPLLSRCLDSIAPLADEIIVVDTGASAAARETVWSHGGRVILAEWADDFAAARNRYLDAAGRSWVLVLDGDEILGACDRAKVQWLLENAGGTAFSIGVWNYYRSAEYPGPMSPNDRWDEVLPGVSVARRESIRLFPNIWGLRYIYPVRESLLPSLTRLGIGVRSISLSIHHFGPLARDGSVAKGVYYERLLRGKIAAYPKEASGYAEIGELFLFQGRLQEAKTALRICVKLAPGVERGHLLLARCLLRMGSLAEASSEADAALALNAGATDVVFLKGFIEFQRGRLHSSAACFSAILRQNPWHEESSTMLGRIREALAELDGAVRARACCGLREATSPAPGQRHMSVAMGAKSD